MYSAGKLNKQSDNIQLWCSPFPICNQSIVPYMVLTTCFLISIQVSEVAVKVVWYFHFLMNFPQFVVIHTVKGFSVVNKADVFSGTLLGFLRSSGLLAIWSLVPVPLLNPASNIWQFSVLISLKCHLENFEHYFASMWDKCNCAVVWTFFGTGIKTDLFQSCGNCWVFQICWHIECSTFTASSFRIWNSSTGIPSPLLALVDQILFHSFPIPPPILEVMHLFLIYTFMFSKIILN